MTEDSTTLTQATANGHEERRDGVRTYRGRKLEEILPRIREELGPDAIILREREGLVGGFGGFFAQRFIEVQARRGGPSIDVYDEDGEHELPTPERPSAGDPPDEFMAAPRHAASAWSEEQDAEATPAPERSEHGTGDDTAPVLTQRARSDAPADNHALAAPDEQATLESGAVAASFPRLPALPAAPPVQAAAGPPVASPRAAGSTRKRTAARPAAQRAQKAGGTTRGARKSTAVAAGAARTATRVEAPAVPEPPPATAAAPAPPVPHAPSAPSDPMPDAARRSPPASYRTQPRARPVLSIGSTADAALPPSTALSWSPGPRPAPAPAAAPVRPAPPASPATAEHGRRGLRLRDAIARRLNLSSAPAPAAPSASRPLDTAAAASITRDLTASGVSADMASMLIAEAAAHGSPLAPDHTLRAGARAQLVRRIVHAPPLPATGAAVAFVGAGGAGKTSCAASLASAYAGSSTLSVSALSLHVPDGGRALAELLRGMRVDVSAVASQQAAPAVADRRPGSLVILDTAAVSPGDGNAMQALGAELQPLSLDAIYIALPATLGPQAARGVLASFAPLHPTAVAITHADETDQIGVVVEIAAVNRIPLAYLHAGTDPRTALSAVDADAIVSRLLP